MRDLLLKLLYSFVIVIAVSGTMLGAKKYALVVGIDDYPGERKLEGSVNDANAMAALLRDKGFTEIKLLLNKDATRAQILADLRRFQALVNPGDLFFFYFGGHGTVFPDAESEEDDEKGRKITGIASRAGQPGLPDGEYDSAICPVDHRLRTSNKRWGNLILDDELSDEFAEFTAKETGVLFVSDSCNSGSVGRPFGAATTRSLPPQFAYDQSALEKEKRSPVVKKAKNPKLDTLKDRFVSITAAADNKPAEEFEDNDRKVWGVFTYYLLQILREKPDITIGELQPALDERTARKNPDQKAQVDTRFFDTAKKQKFFFPFSTEKGRMNALVGTWDGEGTSEGKKVRDEMIVEWAFNERFLKIRYRAMEGDGYQGEGFIRFDPEKNGFQYFEFNNGKWPVRQALGTISENSLIFSEQQPGENIRLVFENTSPDSLKITESYIRQKGPEPFVVVNFQRRKAR